MFAESYLHRAFEGWHRVRKVLRDLPTGDVLRLLIRLRWNHASEGKNAWLGDAAFHPSNMTALIRAVGRSWIDQGIPPPTGAELPKDSLKAVFDLALQLSSEVQSGILPHARYGNSDKAGGKHGRRRRCEGLWLTALQMRSRNRGLAYEFARIWMLMRPLWEQRSYDVMKSSEQHAGLSPPRLPVSSGFDSMETDIFIALTALHARGWVADVEAMFGHTEFAGEAITTIRNRAVPLTEVVGDWDQIERETRNSLANPFVLNPFVSLPDGTIIVPDPGAALGAIQERTLALAQDGTETVRTLLGHVYETYVQTLLAALAKASAEETYLPELWDTLTEAAVENSPDGFLVSADAALVFEAKVTRIPEPPPPDTWKLLGQIDLMERVSGRRGAATSPTRRPLEQGYLFMERWRASDPVVLAQLPALPTWWRYVLICPVEWPPHTHWDEFRAQDWRPRLRADHRAMDANVSFLSHVDLEVALTVLEARKAAGQPTTFVALLTEWLTEWSAQLPVVRLENDRLRFRDNLADYLVERYPGDVDRMPVILAGAYDSLFESVMKHGFGRYSSWHDELAPAVEPAEE